MGSFCYIPFITAGEDNFLTCGNYATIIVLCRLRQLMIKAGFGRARSG